MAHLLIVEARFYPEIIDMMVEGAVAALKGAGHTYERIIVPGAFEIPGAISIAERSGKFDGYVALGCVVRGKTSHYDYVCGESASGINQLAINHQLAIGYGILTVENQQQAIERANPLQGNKGKAAVEAALRMIELKSEFIK